MKMDESERLGHKFSFGELFLQLSAFWLFTGVYVWMGMQNDEKYLRDYYFLYALLYSCVIAHAVINIILAHAIESTFSFWTNKIFIGNLLIISANCTVYQITGSRLPGFQFLTGLIIMTFCAEFIQHCAWAIDIAYVLKIKIFQLKPKTTDLEE